MEEYLRGVLGFKGERGYSAYEIAVQNGFIGTEEQWIKQIGTSNYFTQDSVIHTATANQSSFDLPNSYTSNSYVDVFVNGFRLNKNEYSINIETKKINLVGMTLDEGAVVEIIVLRMTTGSPNIKTITGSIDDIPLGEIVSANVNYPEGYTKDNTFVIGKMILENDNYYEVLESTEFPTIKEIILTDSTIIISMFNNTSEARSGNYKITLMKVD